MTASKDFSEIQEAARLLSLLLERGVKTETSVPHGSETIAKGPVAIPAAKTSTYVRISADTTVSRGDRLATALEVLCKRGNFSGAVIADAQGLPLAVYNSPVSAEALAAFTSVLGTAIDKAGHLLNQPDADNISMDIDYADKVVLRRFTCEGRQYYLMVICSQTTDERSEIELSLEQIVSMLS